MEGSKEKKVKASLVVVDEIKEEENENTSIYDKRDELLSLDKLSAEETLNMTFEESKAVGNPYENRALVEKETEKQKPGKSLGHSVDNSPYTSPNKKLKEAQKLTAK